MTALLIAYFSLASLALVQGVLFAIYGFENRRFARARWRIKNKERANAEPTPRVALLAPCKGLDPGFRDNLRPLFEQDYRNYTLLFIVEDQADPAAEAIGQLIREYPGRQARIVVSGRATTAGQKVHNLLAATVNLPAEVEVLAFVDSDARPHPAWLGALVSRLGRSDTGAVTGYRWFVPRRPSLSNLVLYSVNSAVAALFGPGGHHLVWGGSWAIRRDVFEAIGLCAQWQGMLSDDLVASRTLRRAGLPIEFEPRAMLASPVDNTPGQTWEFIRRQYTIGRCYTPRWWLGTLAIATLTNLALWGGIGAALYGAATGAAWTWVPGGVSAGLWALFGLRAWLRQELGRACFPSLAPSLVVARWFDILAGPVAGLVNWAALASSVVGSTIVWRGIEYRLLRGGRVGNVRRLGEGPAATLPAMLPFAQEGVPDNSKPLRRAS